MKGYYKNWYQHYLKVEKEKEKELQRGYYSNLVKIKEAPLKQEKPTYETLKITHGKQNKVDIKTMPVSTGRRKKNSFRVTSLLLPVLTILGFVFLWYQMDIGPVRSLTHDVLALAGINDEAADVLSYHTSLLDAHTEFVQKVTAYVASEAQADFETLELLYAEIHAQHTKVSEVADDDYQEANVLWPSMLHSTSEMMRRLAESDNVGIGYEQFVVDQENIDAMIRRAIGLGTAIQ